MGLKHSFTSAKPDPADPTVIGATHWNADHAYAAGGLNHGSLLYATSFNSITHLASAAGVLTCSAAAAVPAWSTSMTLGDGSAAAPAVGLGSPGNTGIYGASNTGVYVAVSGVSCHKWTSTTWYAFSDAAAIALGAGSDVVLSRGAASRLDLASGNSFYLQNGSISIGPTPATTGSLRLATGATIVHRNSANTGDVTLLTGGTGSGTVLSNDPQSVANAGVVSLGPIATTGLLVVTANSLTAIYFLNGTGVNTTSLIAGTAGFFSVAAGTASMVNVYWSVANQRFELQNNLGSTATIRVVRIGF